MDAHLSSPLQLQHLTTLPFFTVKPSKILHRQTICLFPDFSDQHQIRLTLAHILDGKHREQLLLDEGSPAVRAQEQATVTIGAVRKKHSQLSARGDKQRSTCSLREVQRYLATGRLASSPISPATTPTRQKEDHKLATHSSLPQSHSTLQAS